MSYSREHPIVGELLVVGEFEAAFVGVTVYVVRLYRIEALLLAYVHPALHDRTQSLDLTYIQPLLALPTIEVATLYGGGEAFGAGTPLLPGTSTYVADDLGAFTVQIPHGGGRGLDGIDIVDIDVVARVYLPGELPLPSRVRLGLPPRRSVRRGGIRDSSDKSEHHSQK